MGSLLSTQSVSGDNASIGLKGQKRDRSLSLWTTFPCSIGTVCTVCIMVGYVTRAPQQDHLRQAMAPLLRASSLQFRDTIP